MPKSAEGAPCAGVGPIAQRATCAAREGAEVSFVVSSSSSGKGVVSAVPLTGERAEPAPPVGTNSLSSSPVTAITCSGSTPSKIWR